MIPAIDIPTFVVRGAAARCDDGSVDYRSEADLRDALAASWWAHGADVRTEVKVPNCGRIDVLVEFANRELIIEVKVNVVTPTQARQAFQQVHSYLSYRRGSHEGVEQKAAFVVAANLDDFALISARNAYRDVIPQPFMGAYRWPEQADWDPAVSKTLASTARLRRESIERLSAFARFAEVNRTQIAIEQAS